MNSGLITNSRISGLSWWSLLETLGQNVDPGTLARVSIRPVAYLLSFDHTRNKVFVIVNGFTQPNGIIKLYSIQLSQAR